MWIPETEIEIVNAARSGHLVESPIFDAKRELPTNSKELAKDIAAMAVDGGVLLYGLGEDTSKRLTILAPFPLKGQAERVTSIARTAISEAPLIYVRSVPTAADPSIGYLIIVVPPSQRAPHMVVVGGDNRYYGRTATGNTILSQGEVARLYERRQRWELDRHTLLEQAIQNAPFPRHQDFGYLHLLIRPLLADASLLERAREGTSPEVFLAQLAASASSDKVFRLDLNLAYFDQSARWYRQPDGWAVNFGLEPGQHEHMRYQQTLNLQLNNDGSGILFCASVVRRRKTRLVLWERYVAGLTTGFLALFGRLYLAAHYLGPVDIGLAITGLKGAIAHVFTLDEDLLELRKLRPFERDEYRRIERVMAPTLETERKLIAEQLATPLLMAITEGSYNPFK